ncbi:YlaN family protein [Bhargavaea cecembensis]|uniref:YlaN family protein n=1 Tax=Bhargavaea cecembensis TaxID=394098 RepID=UPI00058ED504|nr:YlaN family protein [Bhargavaea cecembensis]
MDTNVQPAAYHEKALELLQADAEKIAQLIKVQMDHLTMPQCPLYEEVLDTQMFGLSREIEFATKLGLIDRDKGREILASLERELSVLHEAYTKK